MGQKERELIDKDLFFHTLMDAPWYDNADREIALDALLAAPKVDAVEVVRCKDCKHYQDGICEQIEYIMDGYYRGTFEEKRPDDFCSLGRARKGGNTNEREKQKGLKPNDENHP